MMKKGNLIAIALVVIAGIYVWKAESTPKAPIDRTVTTKTGATSPVPPVVTTPSPTTVAPSSTGATTPPATNTAPGTEVDNASQGDEDMTSNVPPATSAASGTGAVPGTETASGATQSGVITYYNNYLDYGLSVPRGSYYAGYGGQNGAAHTMGFASGTGVLSFEEAPIKLWYYPNKLLPELGNGENSFYQNPGTNMTYLKLGNGTIQIEGNMEDPIVNGIIQTVHRGD